MVSRKQMPNGVVATPTPQPPISASELSSHLRFPLVVVTNLILNAALLSFTSTYAAGDLSTVSRSINNWREVSATLLLKVLELYLGWWGNFDGYDIVSLTLLTHGPPLYLLTTFYGIRPTTLLTKLALDMAAIYIPFRLFRPLEATHIVDAPRGAVSNRSILNDWEVSVYNSLLAAAIYGLTVYSSFMTWLPVHMVIHFEGLRDISAAHEARLPFLIASFIPVGIAAKSFLFTPATGAKRDLEDIRRLAFNPETATLMETLQHNLWGYSKRTRVIIARTVALTALTYMNTWYQVALTVEGAESTGAAGWASVWATAAVLTGTAFWWVGHVDGVSN
ncbi:hypothetical protein MMC26_003542 [Xylographa opegraphella]|nr:hypothetical protein [Xylographa opegraphella]